MEYQFNKGGRKGDSDTRDCVPRAIAIITGSDYYDVLKILQAAQKKYVDKRLRRKTKSTRPPVKGKSVQQGTYRQSYEKILKQLGGRKVTFPEWTPFTEIPAKGKILVSGHAHVSAVIDGVLHDTWKSHLTKEYTDEEGVFHPRRVRRIKSYWIFPEKINKLTYPLERE